MSMSETALWLLVLLPPGAFMSLGLAVAIKNALDRRRKLKSGAPMSRPLRRS